MKVGGVAIVVGVDLSKGERATKPRLTVGDGLVAAGTTWVSLVGVARCHLQSHEDQWRWILDERQKVWEKSIKRRLAKRTSD